ncbi:hypothetical protein BDR06DRAFT_1034435 [Suillus hirtellus]|nr:hypothetical protein BDR06DRAFT_1034435 [Suillus hirtellus]
MQITSLYTNNKILFYNISNQDIRNIIITCTIAYKKVHTTTVAVSEPVELYEIYPLEHKTVSVSIRFIKSLSLQEGGTIAQEQAHFKGADNRKVKGNGVLDTQQALDEMDALAISSHKPPNDVPEASPKGVESVLARRKVIKTVKKCTKARGVVPEIAAEAVRLPSTPEDAGRAGMKGLTKAIDDETVQVEASTNQMQGRVPKQKCLVGQHLIPTKTTGVGVRAIIHLMQKGFFWVIIIPGLNQFFYF